MIDVRRLRLLLELARRGTITAVAEALAYTPSAVSQQFAALEREAGVPLLERTGRRVALTQAGNGESRSGASLGFWRAALGELRIHAARNPLRRIFFRTECTLLHGGTNAA
jgi:DNA-binding transcriptional ArsR family regulator